MIRVSGTNLDQPPRKDRAVHPITFESDRYGPYTLAGPDGSGRYVGTIKGADRHQIYLSVKPPPQPGGTWAATVNRGEIYCVENKAQVAELIFALLEELADA